MQLDQDFNEFVRLFLDNEVQFLIVAAMHLLLTDCRD